MATGTLMPLPHQQFGDANLNPLALGTLESYQAGTVTAIATYSDVSLTVANPVIITLNSAGRPSVSGTEVGVYLTPGQSYKFILKDSTGAVIWTQDNVSAVPTSAGNVDITGTAGEAITAGQVVYLSDGSGSKTTGQWYKADNANPYSSTLPKIAIAPSSITALASGTVRTEGQVTGLSVSAGLTYYVGTSGALTSTKPSNNARRIGVADSATSLILENPRTPPESIADVNGRLTLTTGVPVTIADVTGASAVTIRFTPYKGNRLPLYDGSEVGRAHV